MFVSLVFNSVLVSFCFQFHFSSVIMQDVKHDVSLTSTKLSFIVLTVVTEDNYANSLMHDPNLVFQVQIHKAVMRHRKIGGDPVVPARPIVSALLGKVFF